MADRYFSMVDEARAIWEAGVAAVRPARLIPRALEDSQLRLCDALEQSPRIIVVGAGKAGAGMAAALEAAVPQYLAKTIGLVIVPADTLRPLRSIRLHAGRPAGFNQPTAEGVSGTREILCLLHNAGPEDVAICLLSGGGSALLPAPVPGVTLNEKQQLTQVLHGCGATIQEMNTVRKHLSLSKGGGFVRAFRGDRLISLIISDVVGDPLDVIASGPTAADPTSFADALAVLQKYDLLGDANRASQVPASVQHHLNEGIAGNATDTLKQLPANVANVVLGNNALALAAAKKKAQELGYGVENLGAFFEGDTDQLAGFHAALVRSIRSDAEPCAPPVCVLSGGETTVKLCPDHGKGGRNQAFALACLVRLGEAGMSGVVILSGGTDGEDGPTDAAGACVDELTLPRARDRNVSLADSLTRHNSYPFFEATRTLFKTGPTGTNVMDLRVLLIG